MFPSILIQKFKNKVKNMMSIQMSMLLSTSTAELSSKSHWIFSNNAFSGKPHKQATFRPRPWTINEKTLVKWPSFVYVFCPLLLGRFMSQPYARGILYPQIRIQPRNRTLHRENHFSFHSASNVAVNCTTGEQTLYNKFPVNQILQSFFTRRLR